MDHSCKIALCIAASAVLGCSPKDGGSTPIIFAPKAFYDPPTNASVYIAGTLSGDGVGYENNSTVLTCYRDRMECLTYSVQQIGSNQVGRLDAPLRYAIAQWNDHEIVAGEESGCAKETINIERKSQSVVWVVEPINKSRAECNNANDPVRRWTIEDSPGWKALHMPASR